MNHPLDKVKGILHQIQGEARNPYTSALARDALIELTALVQEVSFSSSIKKGEEMDVLPRHEHAIRHRMADALIGMAEQEVVPGYGQFNYTTRVYRIYTLKATT